MYKPEDDEVVQAEVTAEAAPECDISETEPAPDTPPEEADKQPVDDEE